MRMIFSAKVKALENLRKFEKKNKSNILNSETRTPQKSWVKKNMSHYHEFKHK